MKPAARATRRIRDTAAGALFDVTLGDPPHERSALAEYLRRPPPPRPSVSIPPRNELVLKARRALKVDEA
jgi:hypothetical protein